ncbi:hypothetical protein ACQEVC_34375 [Plantactinospora sp. CA-294935]|uniref:hypothetical protein n=1 Tax=Plantactinospora sp. CA-294935 TaxID=3240012 RepID=UPI003D8D4F66
MPRPLLLAWGQDFVDEVLDHLDPDVDLDVTLGAPTPDQWRQAPLVLADTRALAGTHHLPAHAHLVLILSGSLASERAARHLASAREVFPGVDVHAWPNGADAVRTLVAAASVADRRPEVRVGVIGGHGGAGATTLAVALAMAGIHDGRRTLLIDADPLGGGIHQRIGPGVVNAPGGLHVVEWDEPSRVAGQDWPARTLAQVAAEVKVVNLSRALDAGQLAAAAMCDLVFVVAAAERNERATRRVLCELTESGIPFALMPFTRHPVVEYLVADFATPTPGQIPFHPRSLNADGRVQYLPGCPLLTLAGELLAEVPALAAAAAV